MIDCHYMCENNIYVKQYHKDDSIKSVKLAKMSAGKTTASEEWESLRNEMHDFFKEFLVGGKDTLGVEEITAILKSVGLRCTTEEVRAMISEVCDPNKTEIKFDDLMNILERHTHQEDADETMRQAFETIDKDGDGVISAEDLQYFMQSLGEDFDVKYAERMLKAATGDKKTPVTFEQYKKTLQSKWATSQ